MARCIGVPRGQRPRARTVAPCAGTGRSPARPGPSVPRDASGSLRTHADDERTGEVGQTRSTGEVSEQRRATGGGGDGGKGSGQREPPGHGAMAAFGGEWAHPLLRSAYERSGAAHLPVPDRLALASRAFAAQSERPYPLGSYAAVVNRWLPPVRIFHDYPLRRMGVVT